jgi:hypothetical protein
LHRVAEEVKIAVLKKLCKWAKKAKLNLKYNLLPAKDTNGKVALDIKQNTSMALSYVFKTVKTLQKHLSQNEA